MSFLDTFLKVISYYNDEEDPLHDTDFIMEWDSLSEEEKKNYVKSFIAGLAIVMSAASYSLIVEQILDYIDNYKDVLKRKGKEKAKETLASEVKKLVGIDDRGERAKKIFKELDEILNCDLAEEFRDPNNMRDPFKGYFYDLFDELEQNSIVIKANNAQSDWAKDLFKRELKGYIKGRMAAKELHRDVEHIISN